MRVQGVILAGAHVWDDQSFDAVLPRPLLPVLGVPMIHHALRWLRRAGARRVTICTNHDAAALWKALRDGRSLDMDLHYYIDRSPRGPAGCLRDAFSGGQADVAVLMEGSAIPTFALADVLLGHFESSAALTVVAESGPGGLRPSGCFIASGASIERVPATGFQDIKEGLVPRLLAEGLSVRLARTLAPTLRVQNLASYLDVHDALLRRMVERVDELAGFDRFGSVWVHRTAQVSPRATLVGPALIGPGTRLEAGSLVVGPAVVGAQCRLNEDSVLTRSILLDGCALGVAARADGSLLLHGAVLPAGRLRNAILAPDAQAADAADAGRASQFDELEGATQTLAGSAAQRELPVTTTSEVAESYG